MTKKLISIVVPLYNEEQTLPELLRRLGQEIDRLGSKFDTEVLLVNDGSSDKTIEITKTQTVLDVRYRLITFSRNFGHQAAILAGIRHAKGAAIVVMDGDLQDPPEIVSSLVSQWELGADVVYAQRRARRGESWFKKITASAFYQILDWLSDTHLPRNVGDFRLMSREVVDNLISMKEKSLYLRGMVAWIGFHQVAVEYDRDARYAGDTKYTAKKMLGLAADAVLSFSERPLRLVTRIGLAVTMLAFFTAIFFLVTLPFDSAPRSPGWLSIILAILILGGVQLVCLGIVGEYVSRIYRETKSRPLYIVNKAESSDFSL